MACSPRCVEHGAWSLMIQPSVEGSQSFVRNVVLARELSLWKLATAKLSPPPRNKSIVKRVSHAGLRKHRKISISGVQSRWERKRKLPVLCGEKVQVFVTVNEDTSELAPYPWAKEWVSISAVRFWKLETIGDRCCQNWSLAKSQGVSLFSCCLPFSTLLCGLLLLDSFRPLQKRYVLILNFVCLRFPNELRAFNLNALCPCLLYAQDRIRSGGGVITLAFGSNNRLSFPHRRRQSRAFPHFPLVVTIGDSVESILCGRYKLRLLDIVFPTSFVGALFSLPVLTCNRSPKSSVVKSRLLPLCGSFERFIFHPDYLLRSGC